MDTSSPGFIREPRHSEKAGKLARLKRGIRRAKCKPFLYRPRWNADEERLLDLKPRGLLLRGPARIPTAVAFLDNG